ncbi:MAG TPA: hypothetical protein VLD67_13090 [Vicinamibacterales bacterium]|nr:hypothetical protein [Vicinamibacterales bacterium]
MTIRAILQPVCFAVVVSCGSAAAAQPPQRDDAGRQAGQQAPRTRDPGDIENLRGLRAAGELINMLDAYALVQAQRALRLSDAQYGQFVPLLKKLQETRRRNHQARNRILAELRKLTAPGAAALDEAAVADRLNALRDHETRAAAEMRSAYEAIDAMLDLRQRARFRIFEEQMENRRLDLLMRARERAGRRGTGGG